MIPTDLLPRLDVFGQQASAWIATWWIHSVLLCVGALLISRVLKAGALREALYKAALFGAILTAGAQMFGASELSLWRIELADSARVGEQIGLVGGSAMTATSPEAAAPAPKVNAPVAAQSAQLRWSHALTLAALLVATFGLVQVARERRRLMRALAGRRTVEHPEWQADLLALSQSAGLPRTPRLTASSALASPIALARGEIVVPTRALEALDPGERRSLLAHELAHLARRDPLWLAASAVLVRLFALQPLQRVVRRRLAVEVELLCDAQAVQWTGAELPLARCLATVASWIAPIPPSALVASMTQRDSSLVLRVERLLAPARAETSAFRRRGFAAACTAGLLLFACAGPQVTPVDPSPDVEANNERILEARAISDERFREGELNAITTAGYTQEVGGLGSPELEIRADGSIHAGTLVLYKPADGSFAELDAHLAGLVAGMETHPLDPESPNGFMIADDIVRLNAAEGAPTFSLLKAMERCGTIGLWNLRFTGDWPGGAEGIAVPLPTDLHEIVEQIEEPADGSEPPPRDPATLVEITIRVVNPGRKVDPVSGAALEGRGPFRFDDSRVVEYEQDEQKVRSTLDLRQLFLDAHDKWPAACVTIDARPGTVYQDILAVLDSARTAGYDRFTFIGAFE